MAVLTAPSEAPLAGDRVDRRVRPRLLDLFCCAGGAATGYAMAGFDVVGVDINPQLRYPFEFRQADAMTFDLSGFDAIHASPPCQAYTVLGGREDLSHYPDLVDAVRERLQASGVPWIIENVPGAPLRDPITLCGAMFGLRSYRHRLFESSVTLLVPPHPTHKVRVNRRGENRRKHWDNGGFITITGDVGVYCGPDAMGVDWMSGNELSQAIPPAYTEFLGRQILTALSRGRKGDMEKSEAWDFVERYADGGEMCLDCRWSDQSGPGSGHSCTADKATDCPALPDDLFPDVEPTGEASHLSGGLCVTSPERNNMMLKAAIAIDDWKLSIFERHLSEAGYKFEKCPGLTAETLILTVKTENVEAMEAVVRAANTEAVRTGGIQ